MDESEDQRRWVLVEKMAGDMEAIKEYVSQIPAIKATVDQHAEELRDVKGRLVSVENTLAEHSADLKEIKTYVAGHDEATIELQEASSTR